MNITVVSPKTKVLSIDKHTSQDGSINWTTVVLQKDNTINTINCDNKFSEQLKVGSSYDFLIQISEQPKAYKNGNGAYMENKFKITGIYPGL